MVKTQISVDPEQMEKLRSLAVKNKMKTSRQELVSLAVNIAIDCINNLDEMDFNNLFNLEK